MGNELQELITKKLTAQLPRKELEERIDQVLKQFRMCVLATANDNIPRATPIEYYSSGTTLYMIADPPGHKVETIKVNPQVSVAVFAPLTSWMEIVGAQITGEASIITDDSPEYDDAMKVYRWEIAGAELGWTEPPKGQTIIKVEATRIELVEIALKKRGLASRQIWEPE
jgi:nitroimidazol reductase NimA-like FMN-containing flavoprotein (pyridoxamine 5'-phosphate oxidase superfamily)